MNRIIYIVGLIVVVIAILSFFGLRWDVAPARFSSRAVARVRRFRATTAHLIVDYAPFALLRATPQHAALNLLSCSAPPRALTPPFVSRNASIRWCAAESLPPRAQCIPRHARTFPI